ncbi:MAG: ATP-binding protein [Phycisphaerae bacterium]
MTATRPTRKIVKIDQTKCTGCGECVPSCAEGAIRIIDGKARLVSENLCDGLGNCLGKCPEDAITIEERPADAFDQTAVRAHASNMPPTAAAGNPQSAIHNPQSAPCGCPGSMARKLAPAKAPATAATCSPARQSQLGHWPVQLALVPVEGPIWQDADVLITADCVPFAYPEFHDNLLAGKTVAVACPKLDDVAAHAAKLAEIFRRNDIKSVTVAHMEVPCCTGIVYAVQAALEQAGKADIPVRDITVGIDGTVKRQA